MVTRKTQSINKYGDGQWVMQEMDTNTGELADDMNEIVWLFLKWVVFLPITVAWYTYKLFKKN